MDAGPIRIVELMTGASTRFVVPVFQRPYSWEEANCKQLWEDILATGRNEQHSHFTGSVVWIQDGTMSAAGVTRRLLIDGQQRITTITLLIIALARLSKREPDRELAFSYEEIIDDGYLVNKHKRGDDHYKLALSQGDRDTLRSLVDGLSNEDVPVSEGSARILENLAFFERSVRDIEDPDLVWAGLQRLEVVSISLTQGQDNPQLIFESMNSTGKDLSSADLIRNFVLMGQPGQDELYLTYWRPIEETLGASTYDRVFDDFVRDWLTVCYAPELPNRRDVYKAFKDHVREAGYGRGLPISALLKEMQRFARYYAAILAGKEADDDIRKRLVRIARLNVSIVNPLILSLYDDYEQGAFDRGAFVSMLDTIESYLFRRAACDIPSHGLNRYFPSLIARLDRLQDEGGNYAEALTAHLLNEAGTPRRFPTDAEFANSLRTRDSYGFGKSLQMLSRLENSYHEKDERDFATGVYTIEHIMPQNARAHREWTEMIGELGDEEFQRLVHNIGNLTLTAYNSELSDGTFEEKKARTKGGYDNEYISISSDLHDLDIWDATTIAARADRLVARALGVWAFPKMDDAVRKSYAPEKKGGQGRRASFRDVFNAGLIKPGDTLVSGSPTFHGTATVTEDGQIMLANGEVFNSPSLSFISLVRRQGGSGARNGWHCWRLGSEDGPLLDELRKQVQPGGGDGEMSENHAFRRDFWQGLYDWCAESQAFVDAFGDPSGRAQNTSSYADFGIGLANCHVCARVSGYYKRAEVGIYFSRPIGFDRLLEVRGEIEGELATDGVVAYWIDTSKSAKHPAAWLRRQFDFDNQDTEELYDWIARGLLRLRAFAVSACS